MDPTSATTATTQTAGESTAPAATSPVPTGPDEVTTVGGAGRVDTTGQVEVPGRTALPGRSWAPDLARGAVLLGIALANVTGYIYAVETGPGFRPVDGSTLDRVLDTVVVLFVNDRSRPMFALLFGFGLVTMARRATARGVEPRQRRRVLLRRQLWLVGFGAVHAALLFEGDILGMYGATGLLVLVLMHRRPRTLLVWGTVSLLLLGGLYAVMVVMAGSAGDVAPSAGYLTSVVERLGVFAFSVVGGSALLVVLAPMLVGVAMARAGLLDRPWEHRPLLRRLVLAGVAVGVAGAAPAAVVVSGAWVPGTGTTAALGAVHAVTGTAMGVAYVSLFALWAARLHQGGAPRRGAPAVLAAVGERSLTCYLLQSAMLAPLLSPWGLGVGEGLGTAAAYGIAVVVWLVTVAVAWALAVTGRRGPAEVLLRRLTYGRTVRPVPASPAAGSLAAGPVAAGPVAAGPVAAGPLVTPRAPR